MPRRGGIKRGAYKSFLPCARPPAEEGQAATARPPDFCFCLPNLLPAAEGRSGQEFYTRRSIRKSTKVPIKLLNASHPEEHQQGKRNAATSSPTARKHDITRLKKHQRPGVAKSRFEIERRGGVARGQRNGLMATAYSEDASPSGTSALR